MTLHDNVRNVIGIRYFVYRAIHVELTICGPKDTLALVREGRIQFMDPEEVLELVKDGVIEPDQIEENTRKSNTKPM